MFDKAKSRQMYNSYILDFYVLINPQDIRKYTNQSKVSIWRHTVESLIDSHALIKIIDKDI